MSRAFNLDVTADAIVRHCSNKGIGISALETLPEGGVRLVCMSSEGAAKIRSSFKRQIITAPVARTMFNPLGKLLW